MAAYLGCQLLYMLFDVALNGFFMDWFEGHLLTTRLMVEPYTKESVYVRDLDIGGFKIFLFWVMVFVACIWLVMLYLVSRYKAGKQLKAAMTEIGNGVQKYMSKDIDVSDVFLEKYS